MSLHTDIPSKGELETLLAARDPASVSIYLPTTPTTSDADAERIAFKNASGEAVERLVGLEADRAAIAAVEETLGELDDDEGLWSSLANSLAVFATPEAIRIYRLPNRLAESVFVGDRFLVKPLLRTVTFPQAAFVLALAQGSVRLIEVTPDLPAREVRVPDLPTDVASATGKTSIVDRSPSGAVQGSEGQKLRMRQYARKIDGSIRPIMTGLDQPLILAAAQPLDSIFRSVCTFPGIADETIEGNPETSSDQELADRSREVLDRIYAAELAGVTDLFERRSQRGRSAIDITDVARAATFGAVDTLIVDIDSELTGTIDPDTGGIDHDGPGAANLTDDIARRVLAAGGRVLAVRADEVPHGAPAVAILRYPV